MSDKKKIVTLKRNGEKLYHGHTYTLTAEDEDVWCVKMVLPLRPARFEKRFETREEAEKWIKNLINGLYNE